MRPAGATEGNPVQGLDAQGYVRRIVAADANPALAVVQSGAGEGLRLDGGKPITTDGNNDLLLDPGGTGNVRAIGAHLVVDAAAKGLAGRRADSTLDVILDFSATEIWRLIGALYPTNFNVLRSSGGAIILRMTTAEEMMAQPPAATAIGMVVRGLVGQTGNLQQWQDSAAALLAAITAAGLVQAPAGSAVTPSHSFVGDPDTGLFDQAANALGLAIGGNEGARLSEPLDGETALLIRRNVGGVLSLQRVSMGAVDSGGAGFKVLRVPN